MPITADTRSTVPPSETTTRSDRFRAAGVAVGITLAALVVSAVVGVGLVVPAILLGLDVDVSDPPVFLSLTVAGQVGFLAVALAYARLRGLRTRTAVPTWREARYVVGATVVAIAAATDLSVVLSEFGLVPGSVIADAATANPTVLLGLVVLSAVVIAPIEEFLFRGVVQGRLRESFGPVGAVAGSSLLFGSIHLLNYSGSLAAVVAGALLIATTGAVLGAAYERTRNLAVPVVAHAAYNAVLLGSAYLLV